MKPEINHRYVFALCLCAALIWLVGPLVLSFLFDAVLLPPVPGKFVPPTQVKATLIDTLKFIGVMGWILAIMDWVIRGFPWYRRGWIKKGRAR